LKSLTADIQKILPAKESLLRVDAFDNENDPNHVKAETLGLSFAGLHQLSNISTQFLTALTCHA
jgi:hypothetical protein